jgi:hypothetical protein
MEGVHKRFYFFIGRTTPPHSGHIYVISQMIDLARDSGTCALVLLGNGPLGGMRTKENPIEHDTKAAFITKKLEELGYADKRDFNIQMMMQPPNRQVVEFVRSNLDDSDTQVDVIQVAGKKGILGTTGADEAMYDDLKKHAFVRTSTCDSLEKLFNQNEQKVTFTCGVKGVDALSGGSSESGSEMSATKVRKQAVECYKGDMDAAFECWLSAFPFYRSDNPETLHLAREIFNQIIQYKDTELPSSSSSKSKTQRKDMDSTTTSKSKTAKRGGGSRRSRRHSRRVYKLRSKKTLRNHRKRK